MKPTRVFIEGLVFSGGDDSEGFTIEDDGLVGWSDGVDIRRDTVARENAHGVFDVPGFLDARLVAVRGLCHASSPQQLELFARRLSGVLAGGGSGRLTVDNAGTTLYTQAQRSGKPSFRVLVWGRTARYEIQFLCPDPRQYGDLHEASGASGTDVTSSHWGNFPASPLIEVHAPNGMAGGYTIQGPDGMRFTVEISGSNTTAFRHFIDMQTGHLLDSSMQPIYGAGGAYRDTWAVPPGGKATQRLVPVSGTGTLTVQTRDTYI